MSEYQDYMFFQQSSDKEAIQRQQNSNSNQQVFAESFSKKISSVSPILMNHQFNFYDYDYPFSSYMQDCNENIDVPLPCNSSQSSIQQICHQQRDIQNIYQKDRQRIHNSSKALHGLEYNCEHQALNSEYNNCSKQDEPLCKTSDVYIDSDLQEKFFYQHFPQQQYMSKSFFNTDNTSKDKDKIIEKGKSDQNQSSSMLYQKQNANSKFQFENNDKSISSKQQQHNTHSLRNNVFSKSQKHKCNKPISSSGIISLPENLSCMQDQEQLLPFSVSNNPFNKQKQAKKQFQKSKNLNSLQLKNANQLLKQSTKSQQKTNYLKQNLQFPYLNSQILQQNFKCRVEQMCKSQQCQRNCKKLNSNMKHFSGRSKSYILCDNIQQTLQKRNFAFKGYKNDTIALNAKFKALLDRLFRQMLYSKEATFAQEQIIKKYLKQVASFDNFRLLKIQGGHQLCLKALQYAESSQIIKDILKTKSVRSSKLNNCDVESKNLIHSYDPSFSIDQDVSLQIEENYYKYYKEHQRQASKSTLKINYSEQYPKQNLSEYSKIMMIKFIQVFRLNLKQVASKEQNEQKKKSQTEKNTYDTFSQKENQFHKKIKWKQLPGFEYQP